MRDRSTYRGHDAGERSGPPQERQLYVAKLIAWTLRFWPRRESAWATPGVRAPVPARTPAMDFEDRPPTPAGPFPRILNRRDSVIVLVTTDEASHRLPAGGKECRSSRYARSASWNNRR